jgi:hypothetical protein
MKATKIFIAILLMVAASFTSEAQNKNLPGPGTDLQTLAAGSYVIAMDNTLQANTAGDFNLKAYGLVVYLLNNDVKVKWSIRAGKSKDGTDFTATAEKFQPSLVAGGVSRDFKAGPFVIYAADTAGVAALITAFYTANSLTGNNRPNVYRLTASVANVDIRYNLIGFKPKANIMTDGGNSAIHVAYMTKCGITTANYRTGPATDLYIKCFTFASEPHNATENTAAITAIKSFVQNGGNFLAQCRAVETFENSVSGHFHTTNGIRVTNLTVDPASIIYPNTDLAFSQYEGIFGIKQNGSVQNWVLESGSSFKNNEHNHATGGTMVTQTPIGASVAKLTSSASPGGLVFYIGNHDFSSITDIESINGIRMYMNAFLTPVAINLTCTTGDDLDDPLPVKLVSFNANLDQSQTKVDLTWTTATEINADRFVVERSTDGIIFTEVGTAFAFGHTTEQKNYQLSDKISSLNTTVIYYRLQSVDIDGKSEYSATRIIRIGKQSENHIKILTYPNPATNELRISIPNNWQNKKVIYEVVNATGQVSKKIETVTSGQAETINISVLAPGFYFVRVSCEGQTAQQKIVKQ